jgi:hypothetical protein
MFMGGDLVIVVRVEGALYPAHALPGTRATIIARCACQCAGRGLAARQGIPFWEIKTQEGMTLCAVEKVLKKIDPDQHTPADFDWRELTRGPKVTS